MVDMTSLARIGSSDLTYQMPGSGQGKFVHDLEGVTALELRMWSDQCLFGYTPNRYVKFTGIVNVSGA